MALPVDRRRRRRLRRRRAVLARHGGEDPSARTSRGVKVEAVGSVWPNSLHSCARSGKQPAFERRHLGQERVGQEPKIEQEPKNLTTTLNFSKYFFPLICPSEVRSRGFEPQVGGFSPAGLRFRRVAQWSRTRVLEPKGRGFESYSGHFFFNENHR